MRGVDEAIEHGVGDGRVADMLVPMRDRQLAGDDGGGAAVSVVDDLQEVAALFGGEWDDAPVVEDQHLDARQVLEHAGIAAVAAGEAKVFKQPRHSMVEY